MNPEQQSNSSYQPVGVPAETKTSSSGTSSGMWAIVCAVVAVLFFPPVFGILGIYLGNRAVKAGDKTLGTLGMVLAAVCMIAGMVIGVMFSNQQQ